jgi:hypothetical protein
MNPMTSTMTECQTCHQPHPWPDGTMPLHPFNNGSLTGIGALTHKPEEKKPVVQRWPFDPVLRQALIDKGVLTPDDLREAEMKIRAVTSAIVGELHESNAGTEDSGRTADQGC